MTVTLVGQAAAAARPAALDSLTAKSAQLVAMLALVSATPEAFETLGEDGRAAYLWACHELADEVRAAAATVS